MPSFRIILSMLSLFRLFLATSVALAAAVPMPPSSFPPAPAPAPATAPATPPPPPPPNSYPETNAATVMEHQSTAFGWQLVGTSSDAATLNQICTRMGNNELQKWDNIGLASNQVHSSVCKATTPKASDALPEIVAANTKTIVNLVKNSFKNNDDDAFRYLCNNLQAKKVSSFLLDDATIIKATCNLTSASLGPKPYSAAKSARADKAAVAAYKDAQSKMFAYMYASIATSPEQLGLICKDSKIPARQADYTTLQLDPTCVSGTICSVKQPISAEEGKMLLKKWTSTSYANVLVHSGSSPDYQRTLCEKLDVATLNGAGMDGGLVKNAACYA